MPKAIYTEIEFPEIVQKANALAKELNFSKSQVCLGNGFSGWILSCFQLISGENPTKVATMKHSKIESVIY